MDYKMCSTCIHSFKDELDKPCIDCINDDLGNNWRRPFYEVDKEKVVKIKEIIEGVKK